MELFLLIYNLCHFQQLSQIICSLNASRKVACFIFNPRRADWQQKLCFQHEFSQVTCLVGLSQHLQQVEVRLLGTPTSNFMSVMSSCCCYCRWSWCFTGLAKAPWSEYTEFKPTKASALSRSVNWYCCSGPRLFPHGPFSPTRRRDEPCSLLSGAPAHGGRNSFTVRAKWDTDGGNCLLRNKLRKAITSRVPS